MAITSSDILTKEFDSKFRGYDPDQVNDFLDEIVAAFEKLTAENKELTSRMGDMQEKLNYFQQLQDSLNNSIVVAQEAGERLKQNARKEAEIILFEAERDADRLFEETAERSRKLVSESELLRKSGLEFKNRLKAMVEAQLSLIDKIEYQDLFENPLGDFETPLAKVNVEASIKERMSAIDTLDEQVGIELPDPIFDMGNQVVQAEEVAIESFEEVSFSLSESDVMENTDANKSESVIGRTISIDLPS